mgnify:FL=1
MLSRDGPKQLRYLIKWCGLPYAECTWEKAQDLQDKDLDMHVQLYLQRQVSKQAPRTLPCSMPA